MAGWFRDCKGENYVEMRAFHPETGPLLFTMQRQDGKTGDELRREAEDMLRLFCGPDQPIVHCDRDGAEIVRVEAGTLAKARALLGIEV